MKAWRYQFIVTHNTSTARFNWATPVKAWRLGSLLAGSWQFWQLQLGHAGEGVEIIVAGLPVSSVVGLQLGHAGEGVEISGANRRFEAGFACFNWATPVKAWRSGGDNARLLCSMGLQLGHAGEGVEITLAPNDRPKTSALQLGHAGEGVEMVIKTAMELQAVAASIGPRR